METLNGNLQFKLICGNSSQVVYLGLPTGFAWSSKDVLHEISSARKEIHGSRPKNIAPTFDLYWVGHIRPIALVVWVVALACRVTIGLASPDSR